MSRVGYRLAMIYLASVAIQVFQNILAHIA